MLSWLSMSLWNCFVYQNGKTTCISFNSVTTVCKSMNRLVIEFFIWLAFLSRRLCQISSWEGHCWLIAELSSSPAGAPAAFSSSPAPLHWPNNVGPTPTDMTRRDRRIHGSTNWHNDWLTGRQTESSHHYNDNDAKKILKNYLQSCSIIFTVP